MTGHDACRRARLHDGRWTCTYCGAELGIGDRETVNLRLELVPIGQRDELPAYGLPPHRVKGGPVPARESGRNRGVLPLPIAVYCPRRGECGRLQHMHG